ncbi:hypothetical protein EVAR_34054_1 [Eumeta japonica]|uniref:Zinc finger BED domain-containing protein 1 n=1 Tax=Eumeta variegata TaxID=151549 RepID=A0A4C1VSF8_EUMVA|nr:hypothetical protein EVAR_34054_1 [Eumeta japonica]
MKDFEYLTHADFQACLFLLVEHSFVSVYHKPHSTDVVFHRHSRWTSFTQIVSQINTTTFELVKPVIEAATTRFVNKSTYVQAPPPPRILFKPPHCTAIIRAEHFLKPKRVISEIVIESVVAPNLPNAVEMATLNALTAVLKPFEHVAREASGQKHITIFKIVPMLNCLTIELNSITPNSTVVKELKDLQPFQMVENSGFQEYSTALNADYQLPNRNTLVLIVDEKYKLVSESLKKELEDTSYLVLTSDIWTSDREKYPSLSSVIPLVIGLRNVIESKTPVSELAKNLKRCLSAVIEKRHAVYETNRTASKATFPDLRFKKKKKTKRDEEGGLQPQPKRQATLSEIIDKKSLYVDDDVRAKDITLTIAEQICVDMEHFDLDISTRWDSTLQALRRLLEQRVAVQACLPRITCKAELTTEEWIMMEKVSSKIIRKYERFVAERRGEYIAKLAGDLLMALNERFEDLENE